MALRARRAVAVERQQLRWFTRAAAVALARWVASIVLEAAGLEELGGLVFGSGLMLLPVAVTVAILRYHLYDLDRLVSRTVAHVVISTVLIGLYAGLVLGAQSVLSLAEPSEWVVAGATLAAAALFRPVRHRVKAAVDRRFHRTRYDVEREVAAFGAGLRDDIDLDHVAIDLRATVTRVVGPSSVELWLRHPTETVPSRPDNAGRDVLALDQMTEWQQARSP